MVRADDHKLSDLVEIWKLNEIVSFDFFLENWFLFIDTMKLSSVKNCPKEIQYIFKYVCSESVTFKFQT